MAYPCEIKEMPAQATLSIRTRTPVQNLPQIIGEAFGRIWQYMGEIGQPPAGVPFAAYYNMDMQDLDVEVGFPVATVLPGKGDIQPGEIPGGKYATCLYTGPYSGMKPAYDELSKWMEENKCMPTGVVYEMYLNDPDMTPPEKLQTLIAFPLQH